MASDWKIAGEPDGSVPKVGAVYEVRNQRKGTFWMKVTKVWGEWLTGEVVEGVALAAMHYNVVEEGGEVTVRCGHSYLIPAGDPSPRPAPSDGAPSREGDAK